MEIPDYISKSTLKKLEIFSYSIAAVHATFVLSSASVLEESLSNPSSHSHPALPYVAGLGVLFNFCCCVWNFSRALDLSFHRTKEGNLSKVLQK